MFVDHYKTLNISKDASSDNVKKAYRAAALKYHPDKQSSPEKKEQAAPLFHAAKEAHETLNDSVLRKEYDQQYERNKDEKESQSTLGPSKPVFASSEPSFGSGRGPLTASRYPIRSNTSPFESGTPPFETPPFPYRGEYTATSTQASSSASLKHQVRHTPPRDSRNSDTWKTLYATGTQFTHAKQQLDMLYTAVKASMEFLSAHFEKPYKSNITGASRILREKLDSLECALLTYQQSGRRYGQVALKAYDIMGVEFPVNERRRSTIANRFSEEASRFTEFIRGERERIDDAEEEFMTSSLPRNRKGVKNAD